MQLSIGYILVNISLLSVVGKLIGRALKSVLSNRGLGIKAKKCLYEGVILYQQHCTEQRHGV